MKKTILYCYLRCSICRKASKWLNQKGFKYQLIDVVQQTLLLEHLNLSIEQYSDEKKRIFDMRGNIHKSINFDIKTALNEKIIKLLLSDCKLIRRPFLVYVEKIILGFNETEYKNQFL